MNPKLSATRKLALTHLDGLAALPGTFAIPSAIGRDEPQRRHVAGLEVGEQLFDGLLHFREFRDEHLAVHIVHSTILVRLARNSLTKRPVDQAQARVVSIPSPSKVAWFQYSRHHIKKSTHTLSRARLCATFCATSGSRLAKRTNSNVRTGDHLFMRLCELFVSSATPAEMRSATRFRKLSEVAYKAC